MLGDTLFCCVGVTEFNEIIVHFPSRFGLWGGLNVLFADETELTKGPSNCLGTNLNIEQ